MMATLTRRSVQTRQLITLNHGRTQDFFSGGGGHFQKISQKIFKKSKNIQKIIKKYSKIFKNFLKLLKTHYFSIVFSQFNKARGQFLCVWTKNAIYRKFLKNFNSFLKKMCKMHIFQKI